MIDVLCVRVFCNRHRTTRTVQSRAFSVHSLRAKRLAAKIDQCTGTLSSTVLQNGQCARSSSRFPQLGGEVLETAIADNTRDDAPTKRSPQQLRGRVYIRSTAEAAEDTL